MCLRLVLRGMLVIVVCVACGSVTIAQVVKPAATPGSATQPAASQPANVPVLAVDQAEYDFGQAWVGDKLQHTFKITNTGTADLSISNIKPNCGCTIAGDYPRTLAPGASGEIPLALNTASMNGPFKKLVVVYSNDPARRTFLLSLKGEAKPFIAFQPRGVYFGSIYGDQPRTQVVTITNNAETPLKLMLDPLASTKGWTFDLAEKEPGKRFELTATFTAKGIQTGNVQKTALLLTNIEAQHEIKVPASAAVHERIEASPATLLVYPPASQPASVQAGVPVASSNPAVTAAPRTDVIPRTFLINNLGSTPVKVREASADDPAITTEIREQTPGKAYAIVAGLPLNYVPKEGSAIIVKTDDVEKPIIRVPILAAQPSQIAGPRGTNAATTAQRSAAPERMVGMKTPTFSITTMDGKTVSDQELSQTPAVLNFFSPSCGFCKKQMPRVEALRQAYEAKGVRFLFISETMGNKQFSAGEVATKLKELGVNAPAAIDVGNTVGQQFSVSSYPTMFILDKTGNIEAVNRGNVQDLEARLKSQLDRVLDGKRS